VTLFDTHCHLDHGRFAEDVDAVMERAREAGVSRIATIGCAQGAEGVGSALEVARAHPSWIVATAGVHPHDAHCLDDAVMGALDEALADPLCVAAGETGLDYYYDPAPREVQREAFRRQIDLARRRGKPIVVHTRDAAADTLEVLRSEGARDVGGIIHCFSEDAAFARAALDLGFVSSFSGIVTFKNARPIQEAARVQPLDALLVETDAPYLAPVPYRGKRNEPSYVRHTAAFVAELRGISLEELAEATTRNALRIFRMAP